MKMKIQINAVQATNDDEMLDEPTEFECALYRLLKKRRGELPGNEETLLRGKIIEGDREVVFDALATLFNKDIAIVDDLRVVGDNTLYQELVHGKSFEVNWLIVE